MLKNYLALAFRILLLKKNYSITSILSIAVGLTSCLLILLFVTDELSYDKYHVNHARIYRLATKIEGASFEGIAKVNGPWGQSIKEQIPEAEDVTRFVSTGAQILVQNNDLRFYEPAIYYADPSVFKVFSFELLKGNGSLALRDPNSIVITNTIAEKYFGTSDPIGQVLRIDNENDFKVTGVMKDVPSNSHFTFTGLLSMSSLQNPQRDSWVEWNQFYTYVLLRPNSTPHQVIEKFKPILNKNMEASVAKRYTPFLQPLASIHLHSKLFREITANSDISYIYIFSSLALLILAISCANFINIATAQASVRAKEIGVRKVSGGLRKSLVFQFLIEAFVMCFVALIIAQILTTLALPVLNELTSKNLSLDSLLNPYILYGVGGICILTTILAGSYPAFYLSALKPIAVLKGNLKLSGGVSFRKALVAFQFSLSSILLIASIVIFDQLHFLQSKPLGYDPHQILSIPIQDTALQYSYEKVKHELLRHPGVLNVSLSSGTDYGIPSLPEGFTSDNAPQMRMIVVDHDFINTYGISIVAGRNFSSLLSSDTAAYIINEEAARQLGWAEPMNKTISMPAIGRPSGPVIGVIKDFHFRSLREKIGPLMLFIPGREWYTNYSIKIDSRQQSNVLEFIKEKWASFDPGHPFTFQFIDDSYAANYEQEQRLSKIVSYFTTIGLLLACLGLYSLASFTTTQRTKEIGIRKAHGATSRQIITMLSKQYLVLLAIGFFASIPFTLWALHHWLQSFAYHVDFNFTVIALAGLAAISLALATVGYKSMIAAKANPVDSLRNE